MPQSNERRQGALTRWNALNPVGSEVWFFPIAGRVERELRRVRSEAFLSSSGEPVVFLEGRSGYVSVDHTVMKHRCSSDGHAIIIADRMARRADRRMPKYARDEKGEGYGSCSNRIMASGCSWTKPKPRAL